MKRAVLILPLLAACACATAGPSAEDMNRYTEDARKAAGTLMQQLGGELKKVLGETGPENAIPVCKAKAPIIAAEVSAKTGMSVTRVSLKPRNSKLGTPDAWEAKVLADFDARAAKGEKLDTMEHEEVVTDAAGKKTFRYMKAAGTQPVCLMCHGPVDQVGEAVRAKIAAEYPDDKAMGYSVGQVRGAISIKRPL